MADCSIKSRVEKLLRNDVKERFSYAKEENDTLLSLTPKIGTRLDTKEKVFNAANTKVQEINNNYNQWAKGNVVSVNAALRDIVYINIHPTGAFINSYEHEENKKIAEQTEKELQEKGELFHTNYAVFKLNKPNTDITEEEFNNLTTEEQQMLIKQSYKC